MRVLIVEDSTEIIDSVAQAIDLRWLEAGLISTTMGETGVEMARSEQPDVIILDLGLPDVDGFQVLQKISPTQYEILYELVANQNKVVSKQKLLEKIWGSEQIRGAEYLDVYVKRLKETLEREEPGPPILIVEEGRIGYRLVG